MSLILPTEAVKAVITDETDRILFVQRNPLVRDSDQWDLPGGLKDISEEGVVETDEETIYREIPEELGDDLEIIVGKLIGNWTFYRPLDSRIVHVSNYAVAVLSGTPRVNSEEHASLGWFSTEERNMLNVKDSSLFKALG